MIPLGVANPDREGCRMARGAGVRSHRIVFEHFSHGIIRTESGHPNEALDLLGEGIEVEILSPVDGTAGPGWILHGLRRITEWYEERARAFFAFFDCDFACLDPATEAARGQGRSCEWERPPLHRRRSRQVRSWNSPVEDRRHAAITAVERQSTLSVDRPGDAGFRSFGDRVFAEQFAD